jgi:glycosyltransferase involved in cell wall biosynthesis
MHNDIINCLIEADYDQVSKKMRRAAYLRALYPPSGVRYKIEVGKSYPSRISHYSADPLSVFLAAIRFLTEPASLTSEVDADIQHIFFWKRGKKDIPAIMENDQSLSQFLSGYLKVQGGLKEMMRSMFLSISRVNKVKAIIVWSEWAKKGFERDGFPADMIKVIPPPVTANNYTKNYDSQRILFVGRDFRRKGGDIALKAFIKIAKEFDKAELFYVGSVGDDELLRVAMKTGRFKHYQNPSDEMLYGIIFPESDIFLLPTRSEAFAISIIEAMSYSLPVVVSNLASIKENVVDGYNGVIVDDGVEGYVEALSSLLENKRRRKTMGLKGLELVKSKFDPEKVGQELRKVYVDALG